METMEGTVVLAQEGRFQLLDRSGAGHLFILGHAAAAEPDQLGDLQRHQTRVRVRYTVPRNVIGLLAHAIDQVEA